MLRILLLVVVYGSLSVPNGHDTRLLIITADENENTGTTSILSWLTMKMKIIFNTMMAVMSIILVARTVEPQSCPEYHVLQAGHKIIIFHTL